MLKEILNIGNYPNLNSNQGWEQKLLSVFKAYGIILVAMIAMGPLWVLADKLVTAVFHHKSFNSHYKEVFEQLYKKAGFFNAVIFICIAGPVFEEVIFRLPLSFKKRQVAIAAGIAVFYFAGIFYHPQFVILKVAIEVAIALVITGIGVMFIPDTPLNISPKRRQQFITLSICLFGLIHISNYKPLDLTLLWLYPVFIIPQLLIGWGITYMRFKNGFVWGIALHCLVNSVSTLIKYIGKAIGMVQ